MKTGATGTRRTPERALLLALLGATFLGVTPPRCAPVPVECPGGVCQDARCPDGMVYVAEATFPQGELVEDQPGWDWVLFDVHVPAYCIGGTEVMAARYAEFLNATGGRVRCTPERDYCLDYDPDDPEYNTWQPTIERVDSVWRPIERCQAVPHGPADMSCAHHPVTVVTWWGARTYCQWLGQRLPSEAEWERAAKGIEHRRFVWGDTSPGAGGAGWANCLCADGFDETAPVASFAMDRSPVGANDMAGNASEWVEDDFHLDQAGAPTDGSAWVDRPRADRVVAKGGAYFAPAAALVIGGRSSVAPIAGNEIGGFRCAASPLPSDCADRECGPQPLTGVSCGTCPADQRCAAGRCVRADCGPDCGEMVEVPAGPFAMGCSDSCEPTAPPSHEVDVPRFEIDRTEVTNAAYAAFLTAQGNRCDTAQCVDDLGGDLRIAESADGTWTVDQGFANHPVVEVSWYGARAYCAWRGKRLCTEAEWEKAARGTDGRLYPWGGTFPTCSVANRFGCAYATQPVASQATCTSPYGACDLAGNVWEWVEDDGHDSYDGAPTDGSAWTTGAASRVHRGGAWRADDVDVRTWQREFLFPTATGDSGGFRCCRTP